MNWSCIFCRHKLLLLCLFFSNSEGCSSKPERFHLFYRINLTVSNLLPRALKNLHFLGNNKKQSTVNTDEICVAWICWWAIFLFFLLVNSLWITLAKVIIYIVFRQMVARSIIETVQSIQNKQECLSLLEIITKLADDFGNATFILF